MNVSEVSQSARAYWDEAAGTYEQDFTNTLIGEMLRRQVWVRLSRTFLPGENILELNCGTGIDAQYLAEKAIHVVACDISERMIDIARQRAEDSRFGAQVEFRVLATEELGSMKCDAPFDGAFSNFSGLNCVDDLQAVRRNLARLLRPRARVVLVMLGRFVPWEIAWYLAHFDRSRALDRLLGKREGVNKRAPQVHYRSRREIVTAFGPEFQLQSWEGVGVFRPPAYMEHWARRYPRIAKLLNGADSFTTRLPVFRIMANFVLLQFQRCGA